MYRSERLELRLTAREVQMLDSIRGSTSRSAWIRNQIMKTAQAPDPALEGLVTRPPADPLHPQPPIPPTTDF